MNDLVVFYFFKCFNLKKIHSFCIVQVVSKHMYIYVDSLAKLKGVFRLNFSHKTDFYSNFSGDLPRKNTQSLFRKFFDD